MNKLNPFPAQKIIYFLLVVFMAVGLKYTYSQSTSEDLVWILGPTASLVEFITGEQFVKEANIGYVSADQNVAIIPACAGINFMIAAFLMSALTILYRMKRKEYLALGVLAGFAAAYGATLCANSLRIIMSICLYRTDIYTLWITPERVHRLAGVVIYFICLCLLYFGVRKITSRHNLFPARRQKEKDGNFRSSLLSCSIPLFWYLLITLALPALNQASRKNPALFWEHAWSVLAVSYLLFVLMFLLVLCYNYEKPKHGTTGNCHEAANSDRGR